MAYDLHIEQTGKTLEEWIEYVHNNPTLELIHEVTATNPTTGETIHIETPDSARTEEGVMFIPRQHDGQVQITVNSPDEESIILMKSIASEFGGMVIGDEGEEY